jgi:hypothetical protein
MMRGAMRRLALAAALVLPAAFAPVANAEAGRVSGVLTTYQGQPDASRDLHFENCITHDNFLAPTHTDGSFAQSLPPGCYNLRAERGAILRSSIQVGEAPVSLGQVSDLAPLAPARLWNLQSLFPTLLYSPAPSTAFVFTRDTTVVPNSAPKIAAPSSESAWLRAQRENGMGVGAKAAGSVSNRGLFPIKPGAAAAPAESYNPPGGFGPQSPAGSPSAP